MTKAKRKVHPMADLFPMLSPEELKELAADIKENGQLIPIMLDKDGMVIDGRNRLVAADIAGVEPKFETLNGIDAEAYIVSQNLARRHMTPGQRAMVVAMMYPDADGQGRGKKGVAATHFPMVSKSSLQHARKVLRIAGDLAPQVLSGGLSLEKAYLEARNREQLAESDDSKLTMLSEQARDLADLVKEGNMALNEAVAAMQERKRKEAEIIAEGERAADVGISSFLSAVASIVSAAKTTDKSIIDKRRVNQVVKAVEHLQSLVK